jgi:hypothetical protein
MSQLSQPKLNVKAAEKTIKTSIKKKIAEKGINTTTRQGNKELKFLVQKLARYSFASIDKAQDAGQKIGQHIGELLQQRNKQNLDAGTIYQVSEQKNLWSLAGLSTDGSKSDEMSQTSTTTDVEQPSEEVFNVADTRMEEVRETALKEEAETEAAVQDVPDSPETTA